MKYFTSIVIIILPMILLGVGNEVVVHFSVCDEAGIGLSNAVVKIVTQRDRLSAFSHGGSPMREVIIQTDGAGVAKAEFPCYSGEFDYDVSCEGYYHLKGRHESFRCARDSLYYAKLLENKKELSLRLYRKRNPIPLYARPNDRGIEIAASKGSLDYDLMLSDWLPPHGKGKTPDLKIVFVREHDAESYSCTGCVMVVNGGGYILKKKKTPIVSDYEVDTNAVFCNVFDFKLLRKYGSTDRVEVHHVLSEDECLILRTRSVFDNGGKLLSCNYSKIYGPMKIGDSFRFEYSFFNPTPNDPNLEYSGVNLAPRRRKLKKGH